VCFHQSPPTTPLLPCSLSFQLTTDPQLGNSTLHLVHSTEPESVTLKTGSLPQMYSSWFQFRWGSRPENWFQLNPCRQSLCSILSDLRKNFLFTLLQTLASAFILESESRGTRGHTLLSQTGDSPNPQSQVPEFISPGRGCPSYGPALCPLFVGSYDQRGYGGKVFETPPRWKIDETESCL
jgi:hypothetical protein